MSSVEVLYSTLYVEQAKVNIPITSSVSIARYLLEIAF